MTRDFLKEYVAAVNLDAFLPGKHRVIAASVVHKAVDDWFDTWYKEAIEQRGLYMTPLARDALRKRLTPRLGAPDSKAFDLVYAMSRNSSESCDDHIRMRLDNNANVFVNYKGETGSGKSSCSLQKGGESGLYDQPVKSRGDLEDRLCFEDWEVPGMMEHVARRGCGWKDESPRTAGMGSRTALNNVMNLEDMIRASGRSLHIASPDLTERTTTQITKTAIAQTSLARFKETGVGCTYFLVERGNEFIGHSIDPWCSGQLFTWYSHSKEEYVRIALSGGKDGAGRLTGYLQLVSEKRPRIYEALRGANKTDTRDLVGLAMMDFNLDDGTVNQVANITYRIMRHLDTAKGLPIDSLPEFTEATGVVVPVAMCEALEAVYVQA